MKIPRYQCGNISGERNFLRREWIRSCLHIISFALVQQNGQEVLNPEKGRLMLIRAGKMNTRVTDMLPTPHQPHQRLDSNSRSSGVIIGSPALPHLGLTIRANPASNMAISPTVKQMDTTILATQPRPPFVNHNNSGSLCETTHLWTVSTGNQESFSAEIPRLTKLHHYIILRPQRRLLSPGCFHRYSCLNNMSLYKSITMTYAQHWIHVYWYIHSKLQFY